MANWFCLKGRDIMATRDRNEPGEDTYLLRDLIVNDNSKSSGAFDHTSPNRRNAHAHFTINTLHAGENDGALHQPIPNEIAAYIFNFVAYHPPDLLRASQVCIGWRLFVKKTPRYDCAIYWHMRYSLKQRETIKRNDVKRRDRESRNKWLHHGSNLLVSPTNDHLLCLCSIVGLILVALKLEAIISWYWPIVMIPFYIILVQLGRVLMLQLLLSFDGHNKRGEAIEYIQDKSFAQHSVLVWSLLAENWPIQMAIQIVLFLGMCSSILLCMKLATIDTISMAFELPWGLIFLMWLITFVVSGVLCFAMRCYDETLSFTEFFFVCLAGSVCFYIAGGLFMIWLKLASPSDKWAAVLMPFYVAGIKPYVIIWVYHRQQRLASKLKVLYSILISSILWLSFLILLVLRLDNVVKIPWLVISTPPLVWLSIVWAVLYSHQRQ